MVKIISLFLFSFIVCSVTAQDTLLYQDFQDQSFGQFQNIDGDKLELGMDFEGLGGGFNITPVAGPSDYRAVAVSSFVTGGEADNWLITPAVEVSSSQTKLSWVASSLSGDAFLLESYSVLVSTSGSEIEDFNITLLDVTAEEMAQKVRELDLSSFIGQAIFIAFHHTGSDNYALTLDNILVSAPSTQNSAKLIKICGRRYQDLSQADLSLQIVNDGSETIQDLIVSGTINSDEGETAFNDLNILPRDTAYLPFGDLYPFEADRYDIIANISSVNATPIANENSQASFWMVGEPPIKKLVVEEATSTTCGWCPEGTVVKEYMKEVYGSEVINISVHSDDLMANSIYGIGLENLNDFVGYPSATINRRRSTAPSQLEQYFTTQFSKVAPVDLELIYDYDSANRLLSVNLEGRAYTSLSEDLHRWSFVILEDGVKGTSPDFAQANNFSSEASDILLESVGGINWQTLSDPVPATDMVYDDVARDIVGGFDGILESISSIGNGESFSHAFDYTLSSAFDENQIWLVGMVIDVESGEIVNAVEEQLVFQSGIAAVPDKEGLVYLYPNPATDVVNVGLNEVHSKVLISVYDMIGNRVLDIDYSKEFSYQDNFRFSIQNLNSGLYTVLVTLGQKVVTKKLLIH